MSHPDLREVRIQALVARPWVSLVHLAASALLSPYPPPLPSWVRYGGFSYLFFLRRWKHLQFIYNLLPTVRANWTHQLGIVVSSMLFSNSEADQSPKHPLEVLQLFFESSVSWYGFLDVIFLWRVFLVPGRHLSGVINCCSILNKWIRCFH